MTIRAFLRWVQLTAPQTGVLSPKVYVVAGYKTFVEDREDFINGSVHYYKHFILEEDRQVVNLYSLGSRDIPGPSIALIGISLGSHSATTSVYPQKPRDSQFLPCHFHLEGPQKCQLIMRTRDSDSYGFA